MSLMPNFSSDFVKPKKKKDKRVGRPGTQPALAVEDAAKQVGIEPKPTAVPKLPVTPQANTVTLQANTQAPRPDLVQAIPGPDYGRNAPPLPPYQPTTGWGFGGLPESPVAVPELSVQQQADLVRNAYPMTWEATRSMTMPGKYTPGQPIQYPYAAAYPENQPLAAEANRLHEQNRQTAAETAAYRKMTNAPVLPTPQPGAYYAPPAGGPFGVDRTGYGRTGPVYYVPTLEERGLAGPSPEAVAAAQQQLKPGVAFEQRSPEQQAEILKRQQDYQQRTQTSPADLERARRITEMRKVNPELADRMAQASREALARGEDSLEAVNRVQNQYRLEQAAAKAARPPTMEELNRQKAETGLKIEQAKLDQIKDAKAKAARGELTPREMTSYHNLYNDLLLQLDRMDAHSEREPEYDPQAFADKPELKKEYEKQYKEKKARYERWARERQRVAQALEDTAKTLALGGDPAFRAYLGGNQNVPAMTQHSEWGRHVKIKTPDGSTLTGYVDGAGVIRDENGNIIGRQKR